MKEQRQSDILKTKIVSLYEEIPKTYLNPTPTQISPVGPKRAQNDPKKAKDQREKKQKTVQNESYQSMSKPQKHFSDNMAIPNSLIEPKRAKNDPKKAKIKKGRK